MVSSENLILVYNSLLPFDNPRSARVGYESESDVHSIELGRNLPFSVVYELLWVTAKTNANVIPNSL